MGGPGNELQWLELTEIFNIFNDFLWHFCTVELGVQHLELKCEVKV